LSNLRRDLHAISGDAAAGNVMVGIGETYLPAFVLALSASHIASGLVQTLPLLAGGVLGLAAPWLLRRWRSFRRSVVSCIAVQALVFLPLTAAALCRGFPVMLVFALAAVYWGSGMAASPVWNAWVGTLLPERIRARYFARRSLFCQAGVLAGFLAGGAALEASGPDHRRLESFALLFLVAAAARSASVWCLSRQGDPLPPADAPSGSPPAMRFRQLTGALVRYGNGRTLVYLLAAQAAVQIAGPYFTPYMLEELRLSYFAYATLISIAYLARMLCLPALGRLADRWGAERLLWWGGLAIVPVSGLWLVSNDYAYLVGVQMLSGAAWAAFELGTLLVFFEAIPGPDRVAVLTSFNLFNAAAMAAGSMLGGGALWWFGSTRTTYLALFFVSSVARALALAAVPLLRSLRPRRRAQRYSLPHLPWRWFGESAPVLADRSLPRPRPREGAVAKSPRAAETMADAQRRV
jgi:MFS family permease